MDFLKRRRAILDAKKFLCTITNDIYNTTQDNFHCYVVHDGIQYQNAEDCFIIKKGESIEIYLYYAYGGGKIIIDGETVFEGTETTFEYVPKGDIEIYAADYNPTLYIVTKEE